MMGLVYKDLMVQGKTLRYYLIFMLVYVVLVFAGVFDTFILGTFAVVMAMILPMSSMAYDDQVKWDAYAAAAPGGRKKMVAGKYLFTLGVVLASGAAALILMLALYALGRAEMPMGELLITLAACMGVGLLINSVILPLIFKFGAEKSRAISLGVFVVIFGGGMLAFQMLDAASLPALPVWLINALPVVLILGLLIALCLSFAVSLHICEKKEY